MSSVRKKEKRHRPVFQVNRGYRAKRANEKASPDDYGLVPVDQKTQDRFEKNVLSLLREPKDKME